MTATVICALEVGDMMRPIVDLARREAKAHDAVLHLLNVQVIPVFATAGGASAPAPRVVADKTSEAQQALEAVAAEGEEVHIRMSESSIGETIAHYAQKHGALRIVMGNRDRSGLSKLLLGSVTQEVLKITTVPVLVTPIAHVG